MTVIHRRSLAVAVAVVAAGLLQGMHPAAAASDFPQGYRGYHTYDEMLVEMRALEARLPNLVSVSSIGRSYEGRKLTLVKISDNVALDEPEPEIFIDGLHHAREHLSAEQALSIISMLVNGFEKDERVTRLVNEREWWIVPMINPDGGEWDIRNGSFHEWRKNRQPNGTRQPVGTDLNRNYGYRWGCCGGSSGSKGSDTYRGSSPFSTPETAAVRDFVESRVIGGDQQISVHISFHSAGQKVLWPYGYTYQDVPKDMRTADQRVFAALSQAMANRNGYRAEQSSDLYITDGDQIDWMYGRHGVFSFTIELYPAGGGAERWYPDDSLIAPQTARNHDAVLYLAGRARCPWRVIGKEAQYCTEAAGAAERSSPRPL